MISYCTTLHLVRLPPAMLPCPTPISTNNTPHPNASYSVTWRRDCFSPRPLSHLPLTLQFDRHNIPGFTTAKMRPSRLMKPLGLPLLQTPLHLPTLLIWTYSDYCSYSFDFLGRLFLSYIPRRRYLCHSRHSYSPGRHSSGVQSGTDTCGALENWSLNLILV